MAEVIYSVIVNWETQQPLATKTRFTVDQRAAVLLDLIHYTSKFQELYFLYRALEHLLVKGTAKFRCENQSRLMSHLTFHLQRLSSGLSDTGLTIQQGTEMKRSLGVILEVATVNCPLNQRSLAGIPQWISAITGPIETETKVRCITGLFVLILLLMCLIVKQAKCFYRKDA